ncbi:MAG: 4Fe-4S binding protein [Candidatus Promineifilaceae bacterium]
MARPIWFVEVLKKSFFARYLFAKMTRAPVFRQAADHVLFEGDDIIYLPKDRVIEVDEPIRETEDVVLPSEVVTHFIEQAKHHWIMDFCLCRASEDCQDYPSDFGCLFLGEAVLQINPKLGRLVSREEAIKHVQLCREAGLVHLIGRNKMDTIWLGAGPGHRLLTICNCCPCCCIWKILPDLDPMISRKISRMPGVTVSVADLCTGCELCIEDICFVRAISMDGDRAIIDAEQCRGCGRCVEQCPCEAIEISVEDTAFIGETIERISPLVEL